MKRTRCQHGCDLTPWMLAVKGGLALEQRNQLEDAKHHAHNFGSLDFIYFQKNTISKTKIGAQEGTGARNWDTLAGGFLLCTPARFLPVPIVSIECLFNPIQSIRELDHVVH